MLNPLELRDYRPISLVDCVYKLLSRVLTNRLKSTLPTIISPYQGAFRGDRQIHDDILIVNELIYFRKRMRKADKVFKIDLEKVYHHVEWDFQERSSTVRVTMRSCPILFYY